MHEMGLGVVVSMRDMFTRNSYRIQSAMMSLDATVAASSASMQQNMQLVQRSMMMVGAGLALLAVPAVVIASTMATQKALGEMASLGVKDLASLSRAAEEFSNTWGGTSKAAFIAAAYDIKSGIASLADAAVGQYTKLAALTAKATKSTVAEMTSLFATGYGIYRAMYAKMSDLQFGEMFSGGVAASVQAFKTTGSGMASAISQLGAITTTANVPLEEQLTILGMLQATMSGAEAGTKYRAFMKSAAEAGRELNLGFVDQNGNLLGMVAILGKLRERYGETLDAVEKMEIQKAFGRAEAVAVVDLFYDKIGGLARNIRQMSTAMRQGTRLTIEMAHAMNMDIGSQVALVGQQLHNLFEILGELLLPVVGPLVRGLSRAVLALQRMAKAAPGLTRAILVLGAGLGAVLTVAGGVVAMAGTVGLLLPAIKAGFVAIGAAATSVGSILAAEFLPVTVIILGIIAAISLLRRAWRANFGGIRDFVLGAYEKIEAVFRGIHQLVSSLTSGTGRISAELAGKLKAMGLWEFVKTVFMVYYRVREALAGLLGAFSAAFRGIARVLGPPVKALLAALGAFFSALLGVFGALGLVSDAASGSGFRSLGEVIGTVLGLIAQVAAHVIRFLLYPLGWVIRMVALVVRAVVWLVVSIVRGAIRAGKFLYKFLLPLRLIVGAIGAVVKIAYTLWRVLAGDVSFLGGLKKIGGIVLEFLAREGPLSDLTAAGGSIIRTLCKGILALATLPLKIIAGIFKGLLRVAQATWLGIKGVVLGGWRLVKGLGGFAVGILTAPFRLAISAGKAAWSGITNAVSTGWEAVKSIGSTVWSAVAAPFGWIRDAASAAWSEIESAAASAWEGMKAAASSAAELIAAPFRKIGEAASSAWDWVERKATGAWEAIKSVVSAGWQGVKGAASSAYEAGKSVLRTVAEGARSVIAAPYEAVKKALGWVRGLLPFSDAREGPLSDLSAAGRAVLETMVGGMERVASLPAKVFSRIWGFVEDAGMAASQATHTPGTGWVERLASVLHGLVGPALGGLALAPALAGPTTAVAASVAKPLPALVSEREVERTRLLGERVTIQAPAAGTPRTPGVAPASMADLLAKLDGLADRPLEVNITVVSKLDGRTVAQAVYRNIRQEKVKNYETL